MTHKIRGERADGLTHKSCEERADGLSLKIDGERAKRRTHKICEERADGLILEIDGVQRLTHNNNNNNISEERADGLTHWLVDGDGSESGGFRWAKTRTTSCLRRTQRKIKSLCALDCVRCEKTWRSSFDEIENEVHDENAGVVGVTMAWVKLSGLADGFNGVDMMASMASMALLVVWWLRWRRWRCWWRRWRRWRRWIGVDRRW